jgi:ParB/RepB/Spo0J family partition protein
VAGERRWRASRMAGLTEVPVVIKDVSDEQAMELALVEDLRDIDNDTLEDSESHLDSRKQAVDLARALDALEDGVDAARSIAEIGLGSTLRPLKE